MNPGPLSGTIDGSRDGAAGWDWAGGAGLLTYPPRKKLLAKAQNMSTAKKKP